MITVIIANIKSTEKNAQKTTELIKERRNVSTFKERSDFL